MKILLLDIETAPNTAYVWGLFNENIPLARLLESSYILCWSAKWYGEKQVHYSSVHTTTKKTMLKRIHKMLDEADVVVHYNGTRFDIPILNKEFLQLGMNPPAPYKQIDLLKVARRQFKFASNKLDYVADFLGHGKKATNRGFELWVKCMANDKAAWEEMRKYNIHDVVLLEKVYDDFKPWIKNHPNYGLHTGDKVCPNCGGKQYQKRGYSYTIAGKYQRFQCKSCGAWFRDASSTARPAKERFVSSV